MFAKVVLASKPTNGALPLFSIHMHYPDIIHGEVLTHRKFGRNARSMRATPIKTLLEEIRKDPFVPWHWGKNQKGMQASEENNSLVSVPTFNGGCEDLTREDAWLRGRDFAAMVAEGYALSDYHKQVANRIIAPYTWKHTLISSTSWANFLHLRDHEDAEPHFHDLAALVREALAGAQFQLLEHGDWHLPYVTPQEKKFHSLDVLRKLSVARCARISYAPFDGNPSVDRELERYDLLVGSSPLHASPTEHQATPDSQSTYRLQVKTFEGGNGFDRWETVSEDNSWNHSDLSGNFDPGWIQFRKTLPLEFIKDIAA
jgi:hypothetical protein